MTRIRYLVLALFAALLAWQPAPVSAQTRVLATCGTNTPGNYPIGSTGRPFTLQADGTLCVNATVNATASITGFPGASPTTGTPISVTTGGVTGTLPAGAVVVATNVGTTNAAYCKLGASATLSDQYIAPSGGWFAFTVGAATQLTCITSASTTTVNMVGGSGLPTGTGGGGGGSGGVVTNAGTFAVQATLGATQNTNLANIDSQTSRLTSSATNITAGSALATTSFVVGSRYLSTPPTFTNGQEGALQIDANGKLLVNCTGCSSSGAITSWASGTLGAMANYGTSPGAVLVPGVNASVTASALPSGAATSANQTTELASLATIASNTGAAVPAGTAHIGSVNLDVAATGGCTGGVILTAASNNSTSIKGSAGTLCELSFLNTTTGVFSIRLYDTASAPTCSSATGVVANYVAQSNATSPGFTINLGAYGKAFATGIGVCITGANANNDNTNAATGGNLNYSFK